MINTGKMSKCDLFKLIHGCDVIQMLELYKKNKTRPSSSVQFENENDITPVQ